MRSTDRRRRVPRSGLVSLCAVLWVASAFAQAEGAAGEGAAGSVGAGGAGKETGGGGAAATSAWADERAAGVRALLDGTLDVGVEPQTLFDVPLDDEAALEVEAARVRALLDAVTRGTKGRPAPQGRAGAAGDTSIKVPSGVSDPERFRSRVELDRLRLAFYMLPRERRDELLRQHAERREATRPRETDDERRARESEAERQRALEAARAARSEAERLVGEELARLIGLESAVAAERERMRDARAELAARRDAVLGWQRRARDAKAASAAEADALYDALRGTLRVSRDELDRALDALGAETTSIPELGPDPLGEVPPEIATGAARERRASVERARREALAEEAGLRDDRASALLDETTSLNRERLGLLPHLSTGKRDAVTGFTAAGWDQARAEGRQLVLILRYHRHVATAWARSLRGGDAAGPSYWRVAAVAVPWALLALAFAWWRRRSPWLLALADERLAEDDRAARRTAPSAARRAVRFLTGVHRPLEWLLFFAASLWLLPGAARGLLEVQLLSSVVGWALGGALVVNAINALAGGATAARPPEHGDDVGELRLRSLRLVGRVVVAFALVLVLSARLVGEGTIYQWVFSTCWLAALPILLTVVRWWQGTVFERVGRVRKKSRVQAWVLAHREGWQSFPAATVGAVHLFAFGAVKAVRGWLGGFNVARHVHAYLFKRGLDRLAAGGGQAEASPLAPDAFEAFDPEGTAGAWVPCPADEALSRLRKRLAAGRGGVVAVVGARGLGKSSLLRRLGELEGSAVALSGIEHASTEAIRDVVGTADGAPDGSAPSAFVLFDDAQALIKPVIGGLATFDEVLSLARSAGSPALWVFALDASLWPFLQRARDARPLFDEVFSLTAWTEEQLSTLLAERSARAGVTPTYEDLLDPLPPSADELDRQDALKAKELGYVRMLWDHARGNPGLALEAFRSSLVAGDEGVVRVRPLQPPDAAGLEALPDASLFVLRAVLQLAPADAADVARATRLGEEQVMSTFRFGVAHGYLAERAGRVRVTWRWLRAVIRLLERRHLLVGV